MDENFHASKVVPDTLYFFVDMFFAFFDNTNYFLLH